MVRAIGHAGEELCRSSETIGIGVIPAGDDGILVPASIRALGRPERNLLPIRITRIRPPSVLKDRPHVLVEWECRPYPRFAGDAPANWGRHKSCFVRNDQDLDDPLFASLKPAERARIQRAVERAGSTIASAGAR